MIQKSKKGFMMNFVVKFNEMIAFISSEQDKDIGEFGLYLGKYSVRMTKLNTKTILCRSSFTSHMYYLYPLKGLS